ncbi:uncharacterized protein LOC114253789 [Monomorium pharaonis]|uniref:uncharacterized protein LOC114253789 n=1 Tax=Monomorium pharaonis TaxID=307658 RepID=UPI0017473590|nr:uncharacterized protein LOC114253789 [Monomorium pharaonis]
MCEKIRRFSRRKQKKEQPRRLHKSLSSSSSSSSSKKRRPHIEGVKRHTPAQTYRQEICASSDHFSGIFFGIARYNGNSVQTVIEREQRSNAAATAAMAAA